MLSLRAIATYLILIVLVGGTGWLADSLSPKEETEYKMDNSQVDYYSKNIQRIVLTPEGAVKDLSFAEVMTHFKDDGRTEMDKPVLTIYKKGREPWTIRAEKATTLDDGKAVLMRGKVLITRTDNKGEEMKIVTANVKYTPDPGYAETAEHVLMVTKNDATSATGAKIHFEPVLQINLLADVRRKHESD